MEGRRLIIGLGNPGKEYDLTRHNIGFEVIKALAAKYNLKLKSSLFRAKGTVAEGMIQGQKVLLLMPLTFMNESGRSVRKCVDYYKIDCENLIVVTDDVAIPFGRLRIREKGSSGGHNGLKSVQSHLGTDTYPRFRVGVGRKGEGDLTGHVLGTFSKEEQKTLPSLIDKAIEGLEMWLSMGIEAAMRKANVLGDQ